MKKEAEKALSELKEKEQQLKRQKTEFEQKVQLDQVHNSQKKQ